jgi:hypothetical protein
MGLTGGFKATAAAVYKLAQSGHNAPEVVVLMHKHVAERGVARRSATREEGDHGVWHLYMTTRTSWCQTQER